MGSSRKSKKRKHVESATGSDEDAGIYTVELILKARVPEGAPGKRADQQWEYYVKWAGYDSDANTWEPARNLAQCGRLVESFWDDVGIDDEDYPEGTVCEPSTKWIVAEKKRFWQGLSDGEREKYARKERERRAETQQRKALEAAHAVSNESGPEAISPPSKHRGRLRKKHKKPRIVIVKTDSEADSDAPLSVRKSKSKVPSKRKIVEGRLSSDEEALDRLRKRKSRISKVNTTHESGSEEALQPQTQPESKSPELSATPVDKGKRKAVEEPPPDSPSSLFSVDLSEEVTVPSPKLQVDIPPAPERKLSTTYASSSTKSSITKPSPVIPQKIPRRPVNPYNKATESPTFAALAPGIPTKQRLSWSALAPINPKNAKTKALSTKSPSSLPDNLRFKKGSTNTMWVPDGSTTESPTIKQPELTLNALNASPMNGPPPTSILSDTAPRMSPVTMESPMERPPFSPQPPQHSFDPVVDEFLSSITESMPGFTAPLEPTAEPMFEPKPPPALVGRKTINIPKIPKKWKWEGPLFTFGANDEEELIGTVVCTNVTAPKPRGMRIHLTFNPMDRLNFISFHDLSDVPIFLEACKSPDQFATLSPLDGDSSVNFKVVADFMAKHEKVVLVPVWYEKNVVGHLLIFSPSFKDLARQLGVSPEVTKQAADGLIVSLHGWILNPGSYQEESRLALSNTIPAKASLGPAFENRKQLQEGHPGPRFDWSQSLRNNFILHFALRALKFPSDLYEWLTTNFRQYAIYHECERGDDKSEPIEHEMLKAILQGCQAQEWKHHDSRKELRLRVVFVHVGSIRNFHRSPLTQKRVSLDIRFYSYGTDGNVPRYMWGIREIYPIGGVVTFYPSAFIENYTGTIRLIRKISEHPLWMSFITPACLGYLADSACKGQDPLISYKRQGQLFVYHTLFTLIADGEIALITAPPESTASVENVKSWIRNYCRTVDTLGALSIGTAAFNSVCANVHQNDWVGAVQQSVNRDVIAIQRHPAILYEYRRFIIVKGEKDQTTPPTSVEAATPYRFNFQDDFFKSKN